MLTKPIKLLFICLIYAFPISGFSEDNISLGESVKKIITPDDNISWGGTAKKNRTPIEGTNIFYEPEALIKDEKIVSFTTFSSYDPTSPDIGTEYKLNCETQQYSIKEDNSWKKPEKILPGEQLYPFAYKVCEWGPGFFGRMKKSYF